MAHKPSELNPDLQIPELHDSMVIAEERASPVVCQGYGISPSEIALDPMQFGAGIQIPQSHCTVVRAGERTATIGENGH
jgi:hypothetical protein